MSKLKSLKSLIESYDESDEDFDDYSDYDEDFDEEYLGREQQELGLYDQIMRKINQFDQMPIKKDSDDLIRVLNEIRKMVTSREVLDKIKSNKVALWEKQSILKAYDLILKVCDKWLI